MINFGSFFKKGSSAEATAAELGDALRAAETERQALREREQVLSVSRQDALLEGADEDLDAIEAELATIARAAERHDLRIPELRRLQEERQASEQAEADKRTFEEAAAQRLDLAARIDVKFAELGTLFAELEKPAERLRGLRKVRMIEGPMSGIELDGQVTRSVLLHHTPTLARSLAIDPRNARGPNSLLAAERDFMNMLRGIRPAAPTRPEPRQPSDQEIEAADINRTQSMRYGDEYVVRI